VSNQKQKECIATYLDQTDTKKPQAMMHPSFGPTKPINFPEELLLNETEWVSLFLDASKASCASERKNAC
jgi:hypothetical protein